MTPEIEKYLGPRTPPVRDLALRACTLIREIMPNSFEVVRPGRNAITYASGSKMAEWVCYVAPFQSHINLGFLRGTELPDPNGLLEGTGQLLRHIKLRSAEGLYAPAVRELLAAAWAQGEGNRG